VKDTLANFFGSIMLVLDRPFDIGDSIRSGDIEGTVVEVGFRSTKVKTFYDSIVSVSNGQLANKAIDNLGKRRYRRLSTTLGVEYDTPPELIESFCEGIRQIILSHKWTRKDNFNVYFVNFGASSLDIQLMVFWETPEYAREQAEKHRLMIDILRLAKEMGINFAFPTQTVHMFNETQKSQFEINEEYFTTGIEKAKRVTAKPLSLKNPRSNINDREQFGDNDF
jgi:MscS family membrane protein